MSGLQWGTLVPIWRNLAILQGVGLAISLPLAMLMIVLLALRQSSLSPRDLKYALMLLGAWLGLTFCLIALLYGSEAWA